MFYNRDTAAGIAGDITSAFELYNGKYDELKGRVDIHDPDMKIIWCRGFTEPYHADFISEIDDSTVTVRKILKSKPRKAQLCSVHYYGGGKPVYSAFFGEGDRCVCEKYFLQGGDVQTGLKFLSDSHRLIEITKEYFNAEGNAVGYECGQLQPYTKRGRNEYPDDIPLDMLIKARRYYYKNGAIAGAEAFGEYNTAAPLTWYDDRRYDEAGKVLPLGLPPMNPGILCEYAFNYGDGGVPETFTRKSYSYGRTGENTWKFRKALSEKYIEYGIKNFYYK